MIGEIVKNAIIATLGLTVVSFLLIIATTFLSIVWYIIKDTFKNNSRLTGKAFVAIIEKHEKDNDDIDFEIEEHLQELEDKVNKGE